MKVNVPVKGGGLYYIEDLRERDYTDFEDIEELEEYIKEYFANI